MQDTLMERMSIMVELAHFKDEETIKLVENKGIELKFKELEIPPSTTHLWWSRDNTISEMIERQHQDR